MGGGLSRFDESMDLRTINCISGFSGGKERKRKEVIKKRQTKKDKASLGKGLMFYNNIEKRTSSLLFSVEDCRCCVGI